MKITSTEFQQAVRFDPAWASRLTEPVEVTGFCDMKGSNITHLSPRLTFSGKNADGWAADFTNCKNLKIAEGTFHGLARFSSSGIREIGELEITQPGNSGVAATFDGCDNLKTARGKFAGAAVFTASGVENIGELHTVAIPSPRDPEKTLGADFCGCLNLKDHGSSWRPDWNTAPNKLAHYFAKLIHKLDTLAERLLDIGQVAIATAEHLEKTATDLHSDGLSHIRNAAASLNQSADKNIHNGAERIRKSWQDLHEFVNDGIQNGAETALANLIRKQFGSMEKTRPYPDTKTKDLGVEMGR